MLRFVYSQLRLIAIQIGIICGAFTYCLECPVILAAENY